MIESSTIVTNSAQNGGGVHGDGWGSIVNSIIMFNAAPAGPNINGLASCTYSCSVPEPSGPGNISADPAFITIGADNFRLQFSSACLNAGANQPWMTGATDLAGNPRISCGKVDMGAYEMLYGSGVPAVGITSAMISIAYHLPTGPIAGTNNLNIVGTVWWSNNNSNTTGPVTPDPLDPTAWTADIPLVHGNNLIVVNGSNCFGVGAQDDIILHRETYHEAMPQISPDTLIFPYGGSMLNVDHPTNITWNPAGIFDLVDGTNLTINCISIHRSNDLAEVSVPATNMHNGTGWCPWQPPQELISGPTTYVVRFAVIDSSSLSNSWVFYDHAFTVVPEPVTTWVVLLVYIVGGRKLNRC
jgi:hypothetical protein